MVWLILKCYGRPVQHTTNNVCMYACMPYLYVCMYACTHVCIYACMCHIFMYACMHACKCAISPCMHACKCAISPCMHACKCAISPCMHKECAQMTFLNVCTHVIIISVCMQHLQSDKWKSRLGSVHCFAYI